MMSQRIADELEVYLENWKPEHKTGSWTLTRDEWQCVIDALRRVVRDRTGRSTPVACDALQDLKPD